jgi:S1-C subfamily serine protease/tetratricopeptide (TPR) repeat protein
VKAKALMAKPLVKRGLLGGGALLVAFGLFRAGGWYSGGPSVAAADVSWKKPAAPAAPSRKAGPASAPSLKRTLGKEAIADKPTPAIAGKIVAKAVAATKPAVATFSPAQVFKDASPAVALVQVRDNSLRPRGQGTGFFVSSDGLFVTSLHVITGASFASVQTSDGRALFVEGVAGTDEQADLALLKIRTDKTPFLKLASGATSSSKVCAIGFQQGQVRSINDSQLGSLDVDKGFRILQTAATPSPDSSGGPVIGSDGSVVGVIRASSDSSLKTFAIPADRVRSLIDQRLPVQTIASAAGDALDTADALAFAQTFMALDRGDLKAASTILSNMRGRQARNPLYWFLDGALHSMLSNLDLAADSYRQAIKLKPDMTLAHESLAQVLSDQGKLREAIKEWRSVARHDPTNWRAYQSAGVASSMLGENEKAVAYFDYAIALEPKRAHLHRYRGQALSDLGKNIDAFTAFKNALKYDQNDPATYASIGALHLKLGHPAEAVTALKKSLSLDRTNPTAYLLYGDAAFAQKDLPTARAAWQNAIRFDAKNGPIAKKATEKLKYLGDVSGK